MLKIECVILALRLWARVNESREVSLHDLSDLFDADASKVGLFDGMDDDDPQENWKEVKQVSLSPGALPKYHVKRENS